MYFYGDACTFLKSRLILLLLLLLLLFETASCCEARVSLELGMWAG
jgi:hypothetical protein